MVWAHLSHDLHFEWFLSYFLIGRILFLGSSFGYLNRIGCHFSKKHHQFFPLFSFHPDFSQPVKLLVCPENPFHDCGPLLGDFRTKGFFRFTVFPWPFFRKTGKFLIGRTELPVVAGSIDTVAAQLFGRPEKPLVFGY